MPYMYALHVLQYALYVCYICLVSYSLYWAWHCCSAVLQAVYLLHLPCAQQYVNCGLWTCVVVWCVVCGVWCVVAAGDRWHINSTKQLVWAMSHCLCPNCNGTHPGECEECVPRSPGCDVRPPEYDCWMDVRTRTSGWPLYDTGVGLE
jgi:hypothetical protein